MSTLNCRSNKTSQKYNSGLLQIFCLESDKKQSAKADFKTSPSHWHIVWVYRVVISMSMVTSNDWVINEACCATSNIAIVEAVTTMASDNDQIDDDSDDDDIVAMSCVHILILSSAKYDNQIWLNIC